MFFLSHSPQLSQSFSVIISFSFTVVITYLGLWDGTLCKRSINFLVIKGMKDKFCLGRKLCRHPCIESQYSKHVLIFHNYMKGHINNFQFCSESLYIELDWLKTPKFWERLTKPMTNKLHCYKSKYKHCATSTSSCYDYEL